MTNLGPGVPNNVNPLVTPTIIFTPTPSATSSLRIANNSGYVAYIGGVDVSQFNGLPLPPGNRPIDLQNCPYTVYSCSPVTNIGNTTTVTITSAVAAGSTVLTNTGTFGTSFVPGNVIVLGNTGKGQEVLTIAGTGATTLTVATTTLYDHATSVTVSTATMQAVNITATAGVL